jgi:diguanylate cyclase (GGDEF)-like protein
VYGGYAKLNMKNTNTFDGKANRNLIWDNCLKLKGKDKNYKELNRYLVRDNVNNMLVVSAILIITSVGKCIGRMNHILYSDVGLGIFLIAVISIFLWYFIKCDLIGGIKIYKRIYTTFWVLVNIMGLKYLYIELIEYGSILNYFMLMFLLTGFYIASFQNAALFIIADTFIAIGLIYNFTSLEVDSRLNISIVIIIAIISSVLMVIKYYNYIKDKRARIALRAVGEIDTLTNLLNRRGFEHKVEKLWPFLRDTRKKIMAIMIDIDNFKSYNDTYGHVAGDQCIKDVTECIYDVASRKTDLVVRYGGEEIVVALADISEADCLELAQDIQERVNTLNIKSGKHSEHPFVTVSMGIASMFVNNNNTIYHLIDKADEQLYYSKNGGRNRITMNNISVELSKIV